MKVTHQAKLLPSAPSVLGKAVIRAADRLQISHALLARVLGLSPPTITRLYQGTYELKDGTKEWDFSLLFVRLYRSLDSIVSDDQMAYQWLNSENRGLHAKPITLIQTTEGLVRAVQYLDSSRGIV
ncbi:MAG: antitoxin Xre/MbcA/ParS toxin-binding domain-containing protein [Polynucleobacter sp.]